MRVVARVQVEEMIVVRPVAAVVLTGAMFPVEKRKDVPLPKVREAAVEVLLPVLQSETPIQEDNLFL